MSKLRLRVTIGGAVQGVGFRPFVYRLAAELALSGWVNNDNRGVVIELEGSRRDLQTFIERLTLEKPAPAVIQSRNVEWLDPVGFRGFAIRSSESEGAKLTQILPDIATCQDCAQEIADPAERRHRYPFTNCTHCGPRLSIVLALPYDRPRTTMSNFAMCPACRSEYEDPADRRFHAQPIACPDCGPRLALWDRSGRSIAERDAALRATAEALRSGRIVAVKGLGGFHLMVDARNGDAIARLRAAKPRRDKPLALMVHDLDGARTLCVVDDAAAAVLESPEAPIVLLPRSRSCNVCSEVAPGNRHLGIMLPYTPLHRLLLGSIEFPVVATSGNLSDEPICTDETEAIERLDSVAELFLVHDRPIARHVDDSVVWMLDDRPAVLRRARGYAPRPVLLGSETPCLLAVGAHLKNTVALSVGRQVFVSQHVGDMETPVARAAFERVISDFLRLYEGRPVAVAHDQHPDYPSTRWARDAVENNGTVLAGLRRIPVQHHHAHLAACLAEHGTARPALGVVWDGTGFGTDGTVWGGEFLLGDAASYERVAHLRQFRLPGGDAAVREPRRSAIALLWELFGEAALERDDLDPVRSFDPAARGQLARMMERGVNAPWTTSAGRLFDGVAALVGLHQRTSFEGQAAMALEHLADPQVHDAYALHLAPASDTCVVRIVDWKPLVEAILDDLHRHESTPVIAARFHNALAQAIVSVARAVDHPQVALTGGCFQNRRLVRTVMSKLRHDGFEVLIHRRVPPNDGGIALGQIAVAAAQLESRGVSS